VEARPREILFYEAGRVPDWLERIEDTDEESYDAIVARLERAEEGNLGDYGPAGDVFEFRFIRTGPGYRLYFGMDGDLIIILWAGTKKTQGADIRMANELWQEYKNG
jgi:putative addiction module killer protein